jgi:hypothetical protein
MFGKLLNIGGIKFGSSSTTSLSEIDDEFEEEKATTVKTEAKLQTAIRCLDKEVKARRGRKYEFSLKYYYYYYYYYYY